jgi:hypothetical protein
MLDYDSWKLWHPDDDGDIGECPCSECHGFGAIDMDETGNGSVCESCDGTGIACNCGRTTCRICQE